MNTCPIQSSTCFTHDVEILHITPAAILTDRLSRRFFDGPAALVVSGKNGRIAAAVPRQPLAVPHWVVVSPEQRPTSRMACAYAGLGQIHPVGLPNIVWASSCWARQTRPPGHTRPHRLRRPTPHRWPHQAASGWSTGHWPYQAAAPPGPFSRLAGRPSRLYRPCFIVAAPLGRQAQSAPGWHMHQPVCTVLCPIFTVEPFGFL
jgi:hypothetical protein